MKTIHIIVGSSKGTAERTAISMQDQLKDRYNVTINMKASLEDVTDLDAYYIICTANTGVGEVPYNIEPFFNALKNKPDLTGLKYGLVNLGNSRYPCFAKAGNDFDELLKNCGAARLGYSLVVDASETKEPERDAKQWLKEWLPLLEA
jgi:MioC protein